MKRTTEGPLVKGGQVSLTEDRTVNSTPRRAYLLLVDRVAAVTQEAGCVAGGDEVRHVLHVVPTRPSAIGGRLRNFNCAAIWQSVLLAIRSSGG